MIDTVLRKVATVLRYLFPSARERAYLRVIAREGGFDRAFYLRAHPGLHPLFRLMPARHYIQHGEAKGLSPNGRFSPRAYLYHNPDLDPDSTRPLLHYLQTGRDEARTALLEHGSVPLPDLPPAPAPAADPAPVAVVVHLYYLDMWDEFAETLANQHFAFDLWVTLNDDGSGAAAALRARILDRFTRARVHLLPNHGRDIFPFVWLASGGALSAYAAVCKLHSKKSPHRDDGDDWRRDLTRGVLGDPVRTAARLERFLAHPRAGFWVAPGQRFEGDAHWGVNLDRARALLAARERALPDAPLVFPAGSIYWARRAVVQSLAGLDLGAADFEPEQALVDGTTAHAIERLMGSLAQALDREVLTTDDLDAQTEV
ncbi:rhamnan synthesis F family protein [Sulfitobacter sp. HNIBRBA3233]|uniref:rhamnan synthesis F family protein n=1 Tax=Sulfitobacter marinivivus TaxID=3158558 RepID=UPI0032DF92AE